MFSALLLLLLFPVDKYNENNFHYAESKNVHLHHNFITFFSNYIMVENFHEICYEKYGIEKLMCKHRKKKFFVLNQGAYIFTTIF